MTVINGFTAEHTQELIDSMIVGGSVVGGDLHLAQYDGGVINAGDIRGGEQIPHSKTTMVAVGSTALYTNLSTFNSLGVNLAVSGFVKYRADTKLCVEVHTGVYNDDDLGFYEVAVLLGVTDYVMFNGYSNLGSKSGAREISGIAAGTYTLTAKYRRGTSGIGTVYDGTPAARNCLKVTETF